MNDAYYFIISYALILIIGFVFINFLSNGFFGTFLRVKASRGKKVLVEVHAVTDIYYRAGQFAGEMLSYKSRENKIKSLVVNHQAVFRKIGLFCVMTDEVNDNVIDLEFNAGPGGDTGTYDHLIKRTMMAPQIQDMKDKIIIALIILVLIVSIASAFLSFQNGEQILLLKEQMANLLKTTRVI